MISITTPMAAAANHYFIHKPTTIFQISLFSLALISSLPIFKTLISISPSSCSLVFSTFTESWNSINCLLSSHLCICIIINLMVILIAFSSHHPEKIELKIEHEDDVNVTYPDPIKETPIKEEETMEATWKAINGGENLEEKRKQLEKCETWDMPSESTNPKRKELRKSETFNESVSMRKPETFNGSVSMRKPETFNGSVSMRCKGGMIRRDPSTSLEEFNKQVEDFIKRFNDEMKLQRQESDQRFLDMMKTEV